MARLRPPSMSVSLPESPAATQRLRCTPYSWRTYSSAASLPARAEVTSTYRQSPVPLTITLTCGEAGRAGRWEGRRRAGGRQAGASGRQPGCCPAQLRPHTMPGCPPPQPTCRPAAATRSWTAAVTAGVTSARELMHTRCGCSVPLSCWVERGRQARGQPPATAHGRREPARQGPGAASKGGRVAARQRARPRPAPRSPAMRLSRGTGPAQTGCRRVPAGGREGGREEGGRRQQP